jgi:biotin synthase
MDDQLNYLNISKTRLNNLQSEQILKGTRDKLLNQKINLSTKDLSQLNLLPNSKLNDLLELAHDVRVAYCGQTVEIEGILSAKTGGCPEDCHFCSQSARHESTVKATPLLTETEVLKAAEETKRLGATEFCIVLAIKGPDEKIMNYLEHMVPKVKEETGLDVAVSAGILSDEQARRLFECGTHRYNHNLETAKSYFNNVVTSHSFDERFETCRLVKKYKMQLCCGILFGMGESEAHRIEVLGQLQELDPTEVPLNFLNPRPGTPLESKSLVESKEALKWIAISRLALPKVILRYAGGREITLKDLQASGMKSGINALIVGNYLTTLGRDPTDDIKMLEDLEMPIGSLTGLF